MSINVNGKIFNKKVTIEDVFEVIKNKIDKNAKLVLQQEWNSYEYSHYRSSIVNFTFANQSRCLSLYDYMHCNKPREDDNERYIWLSLGYDGAGIDIIITVLKEFGGQLEDEKHSNVQQIEKEAKVKQKQSIEPINDSKQMVFSYYFPNINKIYDKLNELINHGWHIDSESHSLMPGNEVEWSCIIVATKLK